MAAMQELDAEPDTSGTFFARIGGFRPATHPSPPPNPSLLACSRSSGVLLVGDGDDLRVFTHFPYASDEPLPAAVHRLPGACVAVAWSPCSTLAAAGCADGSVCFFHAADVGQPRTQPALTLRLPGFRQLAWLDGAASPTCLLVSAERDLYAVTLAHPRLTLLRNGVAAVASHAGAVAWGATDGTLHVGALSAAGLVAALEAPVPAPLDCAPGDAYFVDTLAFLSPSELFLGLAVRRADGAPGEDTVMVVARLEGGAAAFFEGVPRMLDPAAVEAAAPQDGPAYLAAPFPGGRPPLLVVAHCRLSDEHVSLFRRGPAGWAGCDIELDPLQIRLPLAQDGGESFVTGLAFCVTQPCEVKHPTDAAQDPITDLPQVLLLMSDGSLEVWALGTLDGAHQGVCHPPQLPTLRAEVGALPAAVAPPPENGAGDELEQAALAAALPDDEDDLEDDLNDGDGSPGAESGDLEAAARAAALPDDATDEDDEGWEEDSRGDARTFGPTDEGDASDDGSAQESMGSIQGVVGRTRARPRSYEDSASEDDVSGADSRAASSERSVMSRNVRPARLLSAGSSADDDATSAPSPEVFGGTSAALFEGFGRGGPHPASGTSLTNPLFGAPSPASLFGAPQQGGAGRPFGGDSSTSLFGPRPDGGAAFGAAPPQGTAAPPWPTPPPASDSEVGAPAEASSAFHLPAFSQPAPSADAARAAPPPARVEPPADDADDIVLVDVLPLREVAPVAAAPTPWERPPRAARPMPPLLAGLARALEGVQPEKAAPARLEGPEAARKLQTDFHAEIENARHAERKAAALAQYAQGVKGDAMGALQDSVLEGMRQTLEAARGWYEDAGAPEFHATWAAKDEAQKRLAVLDKMREELQEEAEDDADELWPGKQGKRAAALPVFLARVQEQLRERRSAVQSRLQAVLELQGSLALHSGAGAAASEASVVRTVQDVRAATASLRARLLALQRQLLDAADDGDERAAVLAALQRAQPPAASPPPSTAATPPLRTPAAAATPLSAAASARTPLGGASSRRSPLGDWATLPPGAASPLDATPRPRAAKGRRLRELLDRSTAPGCTVTRVDVAAPPLQARAGALRVRARPRAPPAAPEAPQTRAAPVQSAPAEPRRPADSAPAKRPAVAAPPKESAQQPPRATPPQLGGSLPVQPAPLFAPPAASQAAPSAPRPQPFPLTLQAPKPAPQPTQPAPPPAPQPQPSASMPTAAAKPKPKAPSSQPPIPDMSLYRKALQTNAANAGKVQTAAAATPGPPRVPSSAAKAAAEAAMQRVTSAAAAASAASAPATSTPSQAAPLFGAFAPPSASSAAASVAAPAPVSSAPSLFGAPSALSKPLFGAAQSPALGASQPVASAADASAASVEPIRADSKSSSSAGSELAMPLQGLAGALPAAPASSSSIFSAFAPPAATPPAASGPAPVFPGLSTPAPAASSASSTSIFGAPATATSIFGTSKAAADSAASPFVTAAPTAAAPSQASVFGALPAASQAGSPPAAPLLFGAAPASAAAPSPFGAASGGAVSSLFGGLSVGSAASSSALSVFGGGPASSAASVFAPASGASVFSAATSGASVFGAPSSPFPAASSSAFAGAFGAPFGAPTAPAAPASGGSLFPAFGQPAAPAAPFSQAGFGQPAVPGFGAPSPLGGALPAFGQPAALGTGFSVTPAVSTGTPAFGQPSAFGAASMAGSAAFGAPSAPAPFGGGGFAAAATVGGGFAAFAANTQSAFGAAGSQPAFGGGMSVFGSGMPASGGFSAFGASQAAFGGTSTFGGGAAASPFGGVASPGTGSNWQPRR